MTLCRVRLQEHLVDLDEAIAILVLLSKYDSNLWLRRDWVQFEMGDDRHHPLLSLWLRH